MQLKILLCDDHVLFREALAALLARHAGWRIVAEADEGDAAIRLAGKHRPDLAVLDVSMPGVSGIEAAEGIRGVAPDTRIIALSMYGDLLYRQRMFDAGADAYVLKNEAGAQLEQAIDAVLRGETFISPTLREQQAPEPQRCAELEQEKLSGREREVLRRLAQGQRAKDIALALGISVKTVETHRARLMLKLRIDNLVGLVKFAIRAGLVSSD